MDSIQIGSEDAQDPGTPPEGAEGDGSRVDLPSDASTKPEPAGDSGDDNRPGWLPEKFKSPEDMAKAYGELESRLGSSSDDDEGADEGASDDAGDEGEAGDLETPDGVSLQDIFQEYQENDGELSEETYAKFAAAGIGQDLVDSFVDAQVQAGDQVKSAIMDEVGGEEAFGQISEWAHANLSEERVEAFNRAAASGDLEVAKLAARGLRSDYDEANGQDPDLVSGEGNASRTGPQPFESDSEVVEAMSDPRYRTDAAYRAKVEKRLAASN